MHLIVHDKVIELSKNPMSKISYSWLVILKEGYSQQICNMIVIWCCSQFLTVVNFYFESVIDIVYYHCIPANVLTENICLPLIVRSKYGHALENVMMAKNY